MKARAEHARSTRYISCVLQAGTLALLVIAVAAAGHSSAAVDAGLSRGACGPSGPAPSRQDLLYAREYRRLLTARAATVWPGWGRRVPPLLQRKGSCEYLIGHPRPPRGFARLTGIEVLGSPVYIASSGTSTPGPVASTWKVGSVWAAMVPTRGDFQRALDRALGSGAVRLSDTTYMRSLVHEAFHAHQLTVTHATLPSFGSTLDERQAVDLLSPVGDVESLFAREGDALASALGASTIRAARNEAARFIALRAQRRDATSDPAALGAFERQLEWMEGTARYADLQLILLAGTRAYAPTKGVRYTPADLYRRTFLDGLAVRAPRPDGLRGRWQDLGAAEGMLLDRLAVGWREAAVPGRRSLEELLHQAVEGR